jgi:peptidoglycan/xylan/chitin deacetylase (PgdA/CDA1 family)
MYIMTGVKGQSWLTADQILELDATGLVEFGSHTVWHPKLTKASAEEINYELTKSKEYLEKLLNKKVTVMAYPFGLYNEAIKNQTKDAGYLAGLTFDQDAWQNPSDLFSLGIVKFLEKLQNEK